MVGHLIAALIGNYPTTCFVIGLVVGAVQTVRTPRPRPAGLVSGVFLNTFLLWAVGVSQAVNFVMHSVFGHFAAKSIGWAQSPFQLELAFSSLGVAVMAFILHGTRSQLRAKVALVLAVAVFNFGAAGGHVYQVIANHDFAVNNTGLLLFTDLFIPTVGLALVIWHRLAAQGSTAPTDMSSAALEDVPARALR